MNICDINRDGYNGIICPGGNYTYVVGLEAVKVRSPNGDEVFRPGDSVEIRWQRNGRPVRDLTGVILTKDCGCICWDDNDNSGRQVCSGIYLDTDSLFDTTEAVDRLGYTHRVFTDSSGIWHQTNEPYSGKTKDWLPQVIVVWKGETEDGVSVRCRRRHLIQPFWE